MARFINLHVWHAARDLNRLVSAATADMRSEGDLVAQIRRAALSVPSLIAEGAERGSDREFVRFLHMADGSNAEVQAQVMIAEDAGLIDPRTAAEILARAQIVGRMIGRFIRRIVDP